MSICNNPAEAVAAVAEGGRRNEPIWLDLNEMDQIESTRANGWLIEVAVSRDRPPIARQRWMMDTEKASLVGC